MMDNKLASTVLIFLLLACCFSAFSQAEWKEEKQKDELTVYTKRVDGYETKMFLVKTTYKDVLIADIVDVIRDSDKAELWISDVSVGELIERKNDESWISYLLLDLPWPLDQRELVLNHAITTNTTQEVYIQLTCNNITMQKEEDAIRMKKAEGYWNLKQLGADVELEYCFVANTEGNVPSWVIDLFIIDGPLGTVSKLKERCGAS